MFAEGCELCPLLVAHPLFELAKHARHILQERRPGEHVEHATYRQ